MQNIENLTLNFNMLKGGKSKACLSDSSINIENIRYDFSRNYINENILQLLIEFAESVNLQEKIQNLFDGVKTNNTENCPAFHTEMRNSLTTNQEIINSKREISEFCKKHKNIKNIIHIGIGGSIIGIKMICEALEQYSNDITIYWIDDLDAFKINKILNIIKYDETIFITVSKTFQTKETIFNLQYIINYYKNTSYDMCNFIAVTNNISLAKSFGIETVFFMFDFIGGRFSWSSAVGITVALYIGYDKFQMMLNGAEYADKHFYSGEFRKNIPVILGLLDFWYCSFYEYQSRMVATYHPHLSSFAVYVQQLFMESNGKNYNINGEKISYKTSPVVFGGSGISGQHSYFQALYQGTSIIPSDIIAIQNNISNSLEYNKLLFVSAKAQSDGLINGLLYKDALNMFGENTAKYCCSYGNNPVNFFIIDTLNPFSLGSLLAIYEHRAYIQGVLWNLNSFDQMGVEYSKKMITLENLQRSNNL